MHFVQAFRLSICWLDKHIERHIERFKRNFFWKAKKDNCTGGFCLVIWMQTCLPTKHGGLGIRDIETQNISQMLK
jgi:hypothetical protein